MPRYISVALPVPLFRAFTYALEEGLAHPVVPGTRVVVPFHNRREIGICVAVDVAADPARKYKAVLEVPDALPAFPAPLLETCHWLADYYLAPLGIALRSALPARLTGADVPLAPRKTRRVAAIAAELPSLLERERLFGRAKKQRALFELLESLGSRAPVDHLVEQLGCSASVLEGLVERGLVTVTRDVVARDPFAGRVMQAPTPHQPTSAQRGAIDAISAGAPGDVFLLHGVTGSGKTLVYIEVLRRIVGERGRTAIVLVPEIALTPQTVDRFRAAFGDRIAVLHSALSDGERHDEWLALRQGDKQIAVGARSAVFAPLENVGAIIVDEEHEASYKQAETPRYHAREVAMVRARHEGAVVVLGSATPSLESWVNGTSGKYRLLSLPERVGGGKLPAIDVVDRRRKDDQEPRERFDLFRSVISEPLENALLGRLARKEQTILLLNRRGYSAFVQCSACGDVASCPDCSISLTYHRAPERLVCHYCAHQEETRTACARCGQKTVKQQGLGTQQVERLLNDRFTEARIARMDVDTTSGKWAHADILDRVGTGEVDILLGTQMIAKGLDFANVTLVGVIDADVGINLPDFRASERCYQLLSQVAGRAGRGPKGGRVFIQTRVPGHHAVRCAVAHDYEAFVGEEIPSRKEPPYPPTVRLANVVFSGISEIPVAELAESGNVWIRALLRRHPELAVTVIGPAPCPVERIKTRWRWHLLLKSADPAALTRVGRYFLERFPVPPRDALRVIIDRDPVTLL